MEEDCNDGPYAVWQMFNAPTMVLFNNLENAADGLDRLLTSILKLSSNFSEVLVPRLSSSKYPDEYYEVFNTWLIGRLFYIWSVKELKRIHLLSKEAQLKILKILSINGASFYNNIYKEYYLVLEKLIQYYKDYATNKTPKQIILKNFISKPLDIQNVQLDLEPIFVEVVDIDTCKILLKFTLQLLSSSIPLNSFNTESNQFIFENMITKVLYMLENFSFDMKLIAINFFLELITSNDKMSFNEFVDSFAFNRYLSNVETIVKSLEVYYEKYEVNDSEMIELEKSILTLLTTAVDELSELNKQKIINICTVILSTDKTAFFNKELKDKCLSLSKELALPHSVMSLQNKNSLEIDLLSEYYSKKLIDCITNKQIDHIKLQENIYLKQLLLVIDHLKDCDDNEVDNFLINYHLQRCYSVLKIFFMISITIRKQYASQNKLINNTQIINTLDIIKSLQRIVALHKNTIMIDNQCVETILKIVLSIVLINENITKYQCDLVLQLLCLQPCTTQISEQNIPNNDTIRYLMLKYILVAKLIIKNKADETWTKFTLFLTSFLTNSKTISSYSQIISITPWLILNKVLSPSKLIGDILLPAFLTRDSNVQAALTETVSSVACLSLGHFMIVLDSIESSGQIIFASEPIYISLICSQCHLREHNCNTNISEAMESNTILKEDKTTLNQNTRIGLRNLLVKLLKINQYSDIETSKFWHLVERLCNHFYIFEFETAGDIIHEKNCYNILNALFPYITDSNTIEHNPEYKSNQDAAFNLCINLLVKSTQLSLTNNDFSAQSSTLSNIKKFGEHNNERVLLPVTKLFVYFIMYPNCSLSAKAVVYLREICEKHNYTPNQAYHRYKKDYCKLFVECCLLSGKHFTVVLLKVVRAFGFVGYRDFISKDIHHFLPYLIPYSVNVKEVPSMIEEIAQLVQCSVAEFLIERFPHIYVHVYLKESSNVSKKCFDIIEKLTKTSILTLIKKHFRVILTEFLLQYCCDQEKVLNACRHLACHDPDSTTVVGNMNMTTSQIADFLNPKFLGVLAYFDHKLVNPKVALSVKRKALKSFPDIMQLIGVKYLTPLRFKVLATLRSALPLAKDFPKILAEAWSAFIHNIDTISLGPLLPTIAVSILQQFEYAPQEINKIFQYLVLSNENLLSTHISELFFLEDTKITEKVKMVIRRHVKRTQPESFVEKIKWYLQHLNQDIPIIKTKAITFLDNILKLNRPEIHKAVFGGRNIDPVIVELIDSLLLGCKDSDPQVSKASGLCLGQLAAIEAGHLPRQYVQPDRTTFAFSIGDDCFAATALVELSRAFQYEKDIMNMDCYALTIQEILKIYDISPTGSKKDVWKSFPENMHQVMFPLLSSRYTLAYPSQPKKSHPLFGSTYATTFLEWSHNWAGQLIPLIGSESIRDLLKTVHPSMRRDVRTLFLFLPYVLLHAVMSKNNVKYIEEEVLAVIGLENFDAPNSVTAEQSKYKILRNTRMNPNISSVQSEEGNQGKCSKMVYTLLDFLNRWLLEWCHTKQKPMDNENYKTISLFVNQFDKLTIARGNFLCGEMERALQYLEIYMEENEDKIQDQLSLLGEIYANLNDPDSVAGILSIKRSEPSLRELMLAQVATGRIQDAALCYERLARDNPLHDASLKGMIDCYLDLDQPFTALRLLSSVDVQQSPELGAEPLWRLGNFEELERLASKPLPPSRENWGILMGRILLSFRSQDHDSFIKARDSATCRLLSQMSGEGKGESCLRSEYQSVLGLHIIAESAHAEEIVKKLKTLPDGDRQGTNLLNQLLDEWRQRLSLVQSDVRTIEPLLRIRRILLQQTRELLEPTHPATAEKLNIFIGELWMQSAKQARKAGILQQSYMYILNAEDYKPDELFLEKAKIYWARGQNEHSFITLRRGLDDNYPQIDKLNEDQRKIYAKAKLLIAKYNDETTNVDVDVNIGYYKESVEVFKQWEKSLVCLGAYYEKISSGETTTSSNIIWSRRLYALNSYGKALQFGHKYVYQSMPRMLSIWLDVEVTSADTSIHSVLAQMTDIIKTYSERLPLYLYLTAFSQILSRICHPVKEVYLQLKAILVKLILAYPQHTLWMMMCVIKSAYPQRMKRCNDVFSDPRLKEPKILKLHSDFTQLAEKLIELCNKPISGNATTTTVSALVRTLPRLLSTDSFSHIMMPFQEFIKIVLPSKAARQEKIDFNIPVDPPVYIAGIEEHISILPSLQKPRKVTLKGSDGKSYIIMLKPRDDLRKDYRLMEFNGVVNRFLQDAPETRKRRLYIRTYSVLPLNEECGLIEWVPNLVGLRPILMHIYKQKGKHTSNRELKEMMCSNKDPVEKKRRIFVEQLLPKHPPVFQEWFRRVFSDPYGWYQARSAYIRTTAVMSMVGYILGLGDRHGENISFDSLNGDTVHVDFNCLFNKGEAFEWPERVPFRLTHNMTAAMGPLAHRATFRKSCEAVMRVLRGETSALMSVIGPFVYDPLLSWGRSRPIDCAERTNEQAMQHLQHIKQRLNGMVRTKNKQLSLSLSPEGQVEHLIDEATSIHNLCQMYIGWGPFL